MLRAKAYSSIFLLSSVTFGCTPSPSVDTRELPQTNAASVERLRAAGYAALVDVVEQRVAQTKPKMRLERDEADRVLLALDRELPSHSSFRRLADLMPRATIELVRSIDERGVPSVEAVRIADYLLSFVESMQFGNLAQLDENHSHVIGREWHEIDYTGEGTSWEQRRDEWAPKGVVSFKRAAFLHIYFTHASRLGYFGRIYQPEGELPPDPE